MIDTTMCSVNFYHSVQKSLMFGVRSFRNNPNNLANDEDGGVLVELVLGSQGGENHDDCFVEPLDCGESDCYDQLDASFRVGWYGTNASCQNELFQDARCHQLQGSAVLILALVYK